MKRIFIVLTLSFLFAVSLTATAYADSGDESATEEDATEQLRSGELGKDAELGEAPKVDSEGEVELGPAHQGPNPNAPEEEDTELAPAHQGENPDAKQEETLPEAGAPLLAMGVLALMLSAFGGVLVRKT